MISIRSKCLFLELRLTSAQFRVFSAQAQQKENVINHDDNEWHNARPYSAIPGPSKLEAIRAFLPGGKYYGINTPDLFQSIRNEYGNISKFPGMLGKADMLFSFDPKHFEKVYRVEGPWPVRRGNEAFVYYREKFRPDVFKGMGGLVSDQGEKWLKMRSTVNPVMMQPKMAKSYVEPVDSVARDFVANMKQMMDKNNEMPDEFGFELNKWALESIGVIALDQRLGVLTSDVNPEIQRIIAAVRDFFRLSYELEVKPSIWRYYKTPQFNELMAALDVITNVIVRYVDNAVEKLEKQKNNSSENEEDHSVLQRLLKINKDYAIVMSMDMLAAGIDTTSSATATLLYLLAKNPEKQVILREEIKKILPNVDSNLTSESLNNVQYLRACLKESMRLQPIITGNLRASGKDIVLDGYQVPRDTDIAMGNMVLQNEESHYPEPKKFLPERWLRDDTNSIPIAKHGNPFVYLPFGFGPRTCIGKRFAELEIQILVARILREFKVEWNYGPIEYAAGIVLSPSSKLKYKLTKI